MKKVIYEMDVVADSVEEALKYANDFVEDFEVEVVGAEVIGGNGNFPTIFLEGSVNCIRMCKEIHEDL